MTSTTRRAAVLGSPVGHSRSPDLHLAAYRALGLTNWTYDRIECTAEALPELVSGLGPEFVGLSVTMPAKLAALAFADECTARAELVGSANTLVRTERGWRADCTDIDGMAGALSEVGADAQVNATATMIGNGGTALPTVAALADLGFTDLAVVARDAGRAEPVIDLAQRLGLTVSVLPFHADHVLAERARISGVVISTVPASGADALAGALAGAPRLVDVIYDPWPTPLAEAVSAAGGHVVGGLVMLLNQAYSQVEQFTEMPAPREAMAAALGAI
ncbi:shikimate dehydrogenase [Gordonia sp. Z-3]|uniref:Shikimate dehydrogenase n=1 Tax=Gordonia tangerina TaxID=2911060 RepID=A0ABS9DGP1_9ACTN|nr:MULTISPECIES: shikimate dehydrogenase [Gordonia]MAU82786.1 shikimate dehydrogenase [Gordonia sp. (in: high G+C Gram-positive bacteria)]MCF3937469.1 shikimate dehydrogenase [Gordonia tangerina]MED5800301.1 shikimate dehydrogenase [Gordonia sp. Z-3]